MPAEGHSQPSEQQSAAQNAIRTPANLVEELDLFREGAIRQDLRREKIPN